MTITITNGDRRMPHPDLAVVTGAFSYTGRYIARRLLDQGVRVRTLARSPDRGDSFGGRVEVAPLDFSDPDGFDAGSGASSTTPTGHGSHGAGPPSTSRSRIPERCSRLLRGRASVG